MRRTILVPCKGLDQGKSRLASCIGARDRRLLCERFLECTLDVVAQIADSALIRVITADPDAIAIARRYGVSVILDKEGDLNAALTSARESIVASHGDRNDVELMVVPIDLPLATPEALCRVQSPPTDVVIVPDDHGSGTNVLLLRGRAARELPFCFGPDSFQRHYTSAIDLSVSADAIIGTPLSFDVDCPAQYARWIAMPGVGKVEHQVLGPAA